MKITSDQIRTVLLEWLAYVQECNSSPVSPRPPCPELSIALTEIALYAEINLTLTVASALGIPSSSVLGWIALHGGLPRLNHNLYLTRTLSYLDSLLRLTHPNLGYLTRNTISLAPWITLPAREALLDLRLNEFNVVEYGSGASTFFFNKNCLQVITFEDDIANGTPCNWSSIMNKEARLQGLNINLCDPTSISTDPVAVSSQFNDINAPLIVLVDGCDRPRHFNEWSKHIVKNPSIPIVLIVDNSENWKFLASFMLLQKHKASIHHHYGPAYGVLGYHCTSFISMDSAQLMPKHASPAYHDRRWSPLSLQLSEEETLVREQQVMTLDTGYLP